MLTKSTIALFTTMDTVGVKDRSIVLFPPEFLTYCHSRLQTLSERHVVQCQSKDERAYWV